MNPFHFKEQTKNTSDIKFIEEKRRDTTPSDEAVGRDHEMGA